MPIQDEAGTLLANALRTVFKPSPVKDDEEFLTVQEATKKFKVSRWTLARWRRDGKIRSAKLSLSKSGKVLLDGASIQSYLGTLFDRTSAVGRE